MQHQPTNQRSAGSQPIAGNQLPTAGSAPERLEADGLPAIEREAPLPPGLRRFMYAIALGCMFLGVAALREPKQSTASPIYGTAGIPANRALQSNVVAAESTPVGSLRGEYQDVTIYATPSNQPLFVIKDKNGRLLANMISAGELTQRFPSLSLDNLLAGIRLDSNREQRQIEAADPANQR